MLIIDTQSENRLLQQLQRLRENRIGWRAVHLHTGELDAKQRAEVVTSFALASGGQDVQAYFLQAGDVLLLLRQVAVRNIRRSAHELNEAMGRIIVDPLVDLHELGYSWPRLMTLAGERQDALEAAARRQVEQSRALELAHTRQFILNLPVDPNLLRSIRSRREEYEKPVIMVVEDEPFSARLVENVLGSGHEVHLASDGQSAILNYARHAPHVVFLDIDLPDVSGYDVLRRLQSFDPQIYAIMLSGHADRQHILQSRELGAQGFVAKPFTRDKLGQYIARCPHIKSVRTGGYP